MTQEYKCVASIYRKGKTISFFLKNNSVLSYGNIVDVIITEPSNLSNVEEENIEAEHEDVEL